MVILPNKIYKPIFTERPRYIICMGGRASGRSYAASQYALLKLMSDNYFRCAIMRYVLGDIRNSIFQEIRDRIEENGYENAITIKENNLTFQLGQNKINGIGFRKSSGDQKSKLKSLASYNCVIIEEADEVAEEDFMQLDDSLRTMKSDITIIFLLNPPHKNHWIIKRWFNLIPSGVEGYYSAELKSSEKDAIYIHGTYLDNRDNLNDKTIHNFERYKDTKPDHYFNMIKGLVSEGARGRVYKNWKVMSDDEYEKIPYREEFYLDFGFTNDPTAFGAIKKHNENVYIRELITETGLNNQMIAKRWKELNIPRTALIIADSAEPKSIDELRREGWNVIPAEKGQDSVRAGIDVVLGFNVHYTESSKNIDREVQEYRWALDREKEPTNDPIDDFNHHMDGIRYLLSKKRKFIGFV